MKKKFKLAKAFVHEQNLKSIKEWQLFCSIPDLKPSYIPSKPDEFYAQEWISWDDWLGVKNESKYLPFEKARELVQKLNLKSIEEWEEFKISNHNNLKNIPLNPDVVFKNKGWTSFENWLGIKSNKNKYLNFQKAKKFAAALELNSGSEWQLYSEGKLTHLPPKPPEIPTNVARHYRSQGWKSMDDFLNIKNHKKTNKNNDFIPYKEAEKFVRALDLKSIQEWNEYISNLRTDLPPIPSNIPHSPSKIYKKKGWLGYGNWLGYKIKHQNTRNYKSFEEAKEYLKFFGLKTVMDWRNYCNGKLTHLPPKPKDIPTNISRKYKNEGWAGYHDFLNSKYNRTKRTKFKKYDEAKQFSRSLGLKTCKDWQKYIKGQFPNLPQIPEWVPKNPSVAYKDLGWIGIGDWLGTDAFPYAAKEYLSLEEAKQFVHGLNLKSYKEWVSYCHNEFPELPPKPKNIPANPVRKYQNKGWKGFPDFLNNKPIQNAIEVAPSSIIQ